MRNNQLGNSQTDFATMVFVFIGLFALMLIVTWYALHTQLSFVAIHAAWASLPAIEYIHSLMMSAKVPSVVAGVIIPDTLMADLTTLKYRLPRLIPANVKFAEFSELVKIPAYLLRPVLFVIMPFIVVHILKRTKAARLKGTFDIFSLSKVAMHQFPHVRPAIIADLFTVSPEVGAWRREESPIRFGIKHGLLKAYKADYKGTLLPEIVKPTFTKKKGKTKQEYELIDDNYEHGISKLHGRCILDRKKTEAVFKKQMGEYWTGADDLPPLVRGLYAALILFVCAEKDKSFELLDQFNRTWEQPTKKNKYVATFDTTGVDEAIKEYESKKSVQQVINNHAFVNTVMPSLLQAARTKGRIATPLFLWLKIIDRTLWYSMSQEGGQCSWTEACAPRAHKMAELACKGPIYKPYIEKAVEEYEDYLMNTEGWLPLPEELSDELKTLGVA